MTPAPVSAKSWVLIPKLSMLAVDVGKQRMHCRSESKVKWDAAEGPYQWPKEAQGIWRPPKNGDWQELSMVLWTELYGGVLKNQNRRQVRTKGERA